MNEATTVIVVIGAITYVVVTIAGMINDTINRQLSKIADPINERAKAWSAKSIAKSELAKQKAMTEHKEYIEEHGSVSVEDIEALLAGNK